MLKLRAWGLAGLLALAAAGVQAQPLTPEQAWSAPEEEVQARLADSHPALLYAYAQRLFAAGRKDEAVVWFYAGQLRFRYHLAAHPELAPDGEPALMASLNATLGQTLNAWAGGSPLRWAAAMDQALDWDAQQPNATTPKEAHAAALAQTRAGLQDLAVQVRANVEQIRAQRAANGLENRD